MRLLQRGAWALVTLWAVVTTTFAIGHLLPADPARALAGPGAASETVAVMRHALGLDRSLPAQYVCYLRDLLRLDLGTSYLSRRLVLAELRDRLPATFELAGAAILLSAPFGTLLGALAAKRPQRWLDRLLTAGSLIVVSGPTFVWGTLLLYVLGFRIGWFPIAGSGSGGTLDHLWHLGLPAATLALPGAAFYARLARAETGDALHASHIRTARAQGLPERRILLGHALPAALLPLVSLGALDLGTLLGGAAITEAIFGWPGIGQLAVNAMLRLDLPVILGVLLLSSFFLVTANLLADVVCLVLDPRLRGAEPPL